MNLACTHIVSVALIFHLTNLPLSLAGGNTCLVFTYLSLLYAPPLISPFPLGFWFSTTTY